MVLPLFFFTDISNFFSTKRILKINFVKIFVQKKSLDKKFQFLVQKYFSRANFRNSLVRIKNHKRKFQQKIKCRSLSRVVFKIFLVQQKLKVDFSAILVQKNSFRGNFRKFLEQKNNF